MIAEQHAPKANKRPVKTAKSVDERASVTVSPSGSAYWYGRFSVYRWDLEGHSGRRHGCYRVLHHPSKEVSEFFEYWRGNHQVNAVVDDFGNLVPLRDAS